MRANTPYLLRHLHWNAEDRETLCGFARWRKIRVGLAICKEPVPELRSVHVTKARKTDCDLCRRAFREDIRKRRKASAPKTPTVTFAGEVCTVEYLTYQNGRPAIQLVDQHGDPVATATVNLPDLPLGEGEAFIKDYSENLGILEALEAARIVERTCRVSNSGWASFPVVRILGR